MCQVISDKMRSNCVVVFLGLVTHSFPFLVALSVHNNCANPICTHTNDVFLVSFFFLVSSNIDGACEGLSRVSRIYLSSVFQRCVRMCNTRLCLCFDFLWQTGHSNWGSTPHSKRKCLLRLCNRAYELQHFLHL